MYVHSTDTHARTSSAQLDPLLSLSRARRRRHVLLRPPSRPPPAVLTIIRTASSSSLLSSTSIRPSSSLAAAPNPRSPPGRLGSSALLAGALAPPAAPPRRPRLSPRSPPRVCRLGATAAVADGTMVIPLLLSESFFNYGAAGMAVIATSESPPASPTSR